MCTDSFCQLIQFLMTMVGKNPRGLGLKRKMPLMIKDAQLTAAKLQHLDPTLLHTVSSKFTLIHISTSGSH